MDFSTFYNMDTLASANGRRFKFFTDFSDARDFVNDHHSGIEKERRQVF